MTSAPDPDNIGDYLISARSFDEYRAMFSITDADLAGGILDCPGGGSSFTAMACAAGATAIAVDPAYGTAAALLGEHVLAETGRGSAHTLAGSDRYVWDFYGDADGHRRIRRESARAFAQDALDHPERYVDAALPALPFGDSQFDLALCSHFLFTYADRLDDDFHLASLRELHRVSRGEARVFPLLDQGGHSLGPLIDRLIAELAREGIAAQRRQVDYEFQRGGDQMLVVGVNRPAPPA